MAISLMRGVMSMDIWRVLMLFHMRKSFSFFFHVGCSRTDFGCVRSASILLHEPFCDRDDRSDSSSIARCLTSAKCVVNSTYVLFHSSNDLSGIDP